MPGGSKVNTSDGFIFRPVYAFGDHGFGVKLHITQYPFPETQITAFIDKMSHMEVNRFTVSAP